MKRMEKKNMEQFGLERTVLAVFSMYIIFLSFAKLSGGLASWIIIIMWLCVMFGWVIHILDYKSFSYRSTVITLMIQFCMLMYGLYFSNFESVLPTFFSMTLLIALYGVVDYLYITIAVIAVVLLKSLFIGGINGLFAHNGVIVFRQLVNIVVFEAVAILWIKKRNIAMEETKRVIGALERAEQSKNDFLSNISHEIRTPLNTILGMSDISLAEEELEQVKLNIYHIQNAGRNLLTAVNDILDFTELQVGNILVEEETYNITSIVNDVVNMAVAIKEDKNIELIVNMDSEIPQLLIGDEKKIRRVIMNLISNAIKFTESGYVEINVGARRESYGVNLSISITDTGIGISEENIEKLFSSFSQIDTKRNRQESGIGLGLAISKKIAETMGGVITVSSEPGKGTKMTFVVPQKVYDYSPAIYVNIKSDCHFLCYINMERYRMKETRDVYPKNIMTIIKQTGADCHFCRNIEELKRRCASGNYQYIFITVAEYFEDKDYFDMVSENIRIIVVLDRENDSKVKNVNIYKVHKPCYILTVAALLNQMASSKPYVSSEAFEAPDAHLLVVDDNLMNIKVIEGLLKKYKIKITKALSGKEALEKIETMNYDFIFMDYMMPEMDGIEAFHKIREKAGLYYKNVPIIALTANAVAGSREMFINEGFADFVEKPVEGSVLERVLRRNLPESKIKLNNHDMSQEMLVKSNLENDKTGEYVEDMGTDNNDIPNSSQGNLVIEGLDVATGIMYCGDEEGYITILEGCVEDYKQTRDELNLLFDQKDWKNYCIKIHALKGILRTIGATEGSDYAYKLEMACKEANYDMVINEHENVMEIFKETMLKVASHPNVSGDVSMIYGENVSQSTFIDVSKLPALSKEEFDKFYERFDDAMYSLDEELMKEIVSELGGYSYNGVALLDELKVVLKKVEQSDYFSAGELLDAIRKKSS